jgi:hypothetical protein
MLTCSPAIAIAQESTPSLTETRALENVTRGTYDGVRWLSGGVGEVERQAIMETVAKDYSLKLEFARADGSYLSNVDVIVSDAHGQAVATVTSSGPWLLLDLPAGAYRIRASIERRPSFEHAVNVSGSGMQTVVFNRWAAETDSL